MLPTDKEYKITIIKTLTITKNFVKSFKLNIAFL
jgi:hypothetical protein